MWYELKQPRPQALSHWDGDESPSMTKGPGDAVDFESLEPYLLHFVGGIPLRHRFVQSAQ